jgi:hypothetical protein
MQVKPHSLTDTFSYYLFYIKSCFIPNVSTQNEARHMIVTFFQYITEKNFSQAFLRDFSGENYKAARGKGPRQAGCVNYRFPDVRG